MGCPPEGMPSPTAQATGLRTAGTQDIFDNILDRDITWPEEAEMSTQCRDLVDQLLTIDPRERLGRRGAGEIKLHPWFHGLDWTTLARAKAAFIPSLESETDTTYFAHKPVSRPPREGRAHGAALC